MAEGHMNNTFPVLTVLGKNISASERTDMFLSIKHQSHIQYVWHVTYLLAFVLSGDRTLFFSIVPAGTSTMIDEPLEAAGI